MPKSYENAEMNFIDTHIHLQDFKSNCATDIINELISSGVDKLVCASIKQTDWPKIAKLYEAFPQNIIPAFGIHPWEARNLPPQWLEELEGYLLKYPSALVGEAGLDRHRDPDYEPQNEVFKKHIALAKKHNRALLIHAVKCQDWLEDYWKIMPQKFVFHSYTARRELLKKILNAGGMVSYSASILNNREKEKTINATPLDKLMIETDAPYQGEALDIINVAKEIAVIRGMSVEEFAEKVYQNSQEFINNG